MRDDGAVTGDGAVTDDGGVAGADLMTADGAHGTAAEGASTGVRQSAESGAALERGIEAILMVAEEPQPIVALATALDAPIARVTEAVARLVADLDGATDGDGPGIRRGFELREVGGGWRFYVRAEHDALVRDFVATQAPSRLSQAALETLAVIAYKQPVSRGSVAAIRAVNVDSVVRTLVARGLIEEAATDSETGAVLYGTTDLVLAHLGINSLDELPHISPLLDDGSTAIAETR